MSASPWLRTGVLAMLMVFGVARMSAASLRILLVDLSQEEPVVASMDWSALNSSIDLSRQCSAGPAGAEEIRKCLHCWAGRHSTRWISQEGDELHVFVVFNGADDTVPDIAFTEDARRSQLATDLSSAMKLAKSIVGRAEFAPQLELMCSTRVFRLQHKRAHLRVSVSVPDLPAPPGTEPKKRNAAVTLTTGPAEHLFLSADLPIRRLNDVEFGDAGLQPKTKPTKFFVGLNYAMGDLYDDRPRSTGRTLRDNLVMRLMIEASSSPLDSFGIALALRGSYLASFGIDFNTVSPFVGYVWTRPEDGDLEELTGTPQFGFSFNLDKVLGWVQSEK